MKRRFIVLSVAAFFIICALPFALMPLAAEDSGAENRDLSGFPRLFDEGKINASFFDEFSAYVSEHFYFRGQLVSLNSLIKEKLFSTSAQEKVIVGRDGWLFFNETLSDYSGTDIISGRELNNISSTLAMVNEYVNSQGKTFVFFPAPNKNTVYPQYMPSRYVRAKEKTNFDIITDALKAEGIPVLDIRETFAASGRQLYHKRDSHWNNLGALIGAEELLSALGKGGSVYTNTEYSLRREWRGDLDKMLYPSLEKFDDQVIFDYTPRYTYSTNFKSAEDIIIRTQNGDADGSLLMFRDSFGNALLPLLAEEFGSMYYSRAVPYNLNLLNAMDFDYVVIELVERNLRNLLYYAPIMPAPAVSAPDAVVAEGNDAIYSEPQLVSGLLHLYGTLDERYLSDADRIYVLIEGQTGSAAYESFPVYEKDLLEGEVSAGGYSLYIAPETLPEGDFMISVVISNSSLCRKSGALAGRDLLGLE